MKKTQRRTILNIKLVLFFLLFQLIAIISYSQSKNFTENTQEDVVTTTLKKHLQIVIKRGDIVINENVKKENYFNTNENLLFAEERIPYNSFITINNIKAYTEKLVKGKIKIYKVADFFDKDVLIRGVFFNDQKYKSFTYKNIGKGVKTNLTYTLSIKDVHFIPAFLLDSKIPITNAEYTISYPENVKISYTTFNLQGTEYTFVKKKEKGMNILTWKFLNIPKRNLHYDFSSLYYIPQIVVRINSYEINGRKEKVLENVDDLYSWYSDLISDINSTNQSDLKEVTLALIKDKNNSKEIIENIYYYVQDRVNYIAFEDGLNGFVPRDAMNIFNNTYGDCKDMANLLNEMLHYAGIDSYLTWIGTRSRPYNYDELPTVLTDNHMIVTVLLNGNYYFLDPTAKFLKFGYPSPSIQGKQALIGLSKNDYKLQYVPEVSSEKNLGLIKSQFIIKGSEILGFHTVQLTGFNKLFFRYKLAKKKDNNLDFINKSLQYGTKRTVFSDVTYAGNSTYLDTLTISFKSTTTHSLKKMGNKLYINLNYDQSLNDELVKNEDKEFDKKIDYKYHKEFVTTLIIPDDYEIDYIPDNQDFLNDNYNFRVNYSIEGNTISIDKQITINQLKVVPDSIAGWNNFIKTYSKLNKKMIVLKPKN